MIRTDPHQPEENLILGLIFLQDPDGTDMGQHRLGHGSTTREHVVPDLGALEDSLGEMLSQ